MTRRIVLAALVGAALCLLAWLLWLRSNPVPPPLSPAPNTASQSPTLIPIHHADPMAGSDESTSAPAGIAAPGPLHPDERTAVLPGRVVDDDGVAVEGAVVSAVRGDVIGLLFEAPPLAASAVTDEKGEFILKVKQEGELWVFARADGYLPQQVFRDTVARSGRTEPLVITLRRGRAITVYVVDEAAQPVAGAQVFGPPQLRGRSRFNPDEYMTGEPRATDAAGRMVISDFAAIQNLPYETRPMTLFAEKEGVGRGSAAFNPEDDAVTIILYAGGTIKGQVVMADGGAPVEEATVALNSMAGYALSDVTNSGGFFELNGVPPGEYTLTAEHEAANLIMRYARDENVPWVNQDGEIKAGEVVEDIVLKLARGDRVFGWVRNEAGEALKGARIIRYVGDGTMFPNLGRVTNDDGYYEFSCLNVYERGFAGNPKDYWTSDLFNAFWEGHEAERIEIWEGLASGERRIDFTMKRLMARVSGRVTDALTGEPVADLQLGFYEGGKDNENGRQYYPRTNSKGEYDFECQPGVYDVELWTKAGPASARTRKGLVVQGEVTGVDFTIGGGGRVMGRVVDAAGEPMKAEVSAVWWREADDVPAKRSPRTDEISSEEVTGEFVIMGIQPDCPAQVIATSWGHLVGYSEEFILREGEIKELGDLTAVALGGVKGRVVNLEDKPVEATIKLWQPDPLPYPEDYLRELADDEFYHTRSAATNGAFEIKDVLPGTWTLLVSAGHGDNDENLFETEVTVKPSEITDVNCRIEAEAAIQGKGVVSGTVVNEKGGGVRAEIELEIDRNHDLPTWSGLRAEMETEESGVFRLEGLHEGQRYAMRVHLRGRRGELQEDKYLIVTPPMENLQIVMERTGRVKGTVTRAEDGAPVENYSMELKILIERAGAPRVIPEVWRGSWSAADFQYAYQSGPVRFLADGSPAPAGYFEVSGLAPGIYKATVKREGLEEWSSEPFILKSAGEMELQLRVP